MYSITYCGPYFWSQNGLPQEAHNRQTNSGIANNTPNKPCFNFLLLLAYFWKDRNNKSETCVRCCERSVSDIKKKLRAPEDLNVFLAQMGNRGKNSQPSRLGNMSRNKHIQE